MGPCLVIVDWHELFAQRANRRGYLTRVGHLPGAVCADAFLKREAGSIGTADLLMVVLIADAAQNAMADEYRSITDGLVLLLRSSFGTTLLIG